MMTGLSALPRLEKKFWVEPRMATVLESTTSAGRHEIDTMVEAAAAYEIDISTSACQASGAMAASAITAQTIMPSTRHVLRTLFSDQPRPNR